MSGYMQLVAPCCVCNRLFASNPNFVPAYKSNPVCQDCMEHANEQRVEMGLEPHLIHPQAYEPEPSI